MPNRISPSDAYDGKGNLKAGLSMANDGQIYTITEANQANKDFEEKNKEKEKKEQKEQVVVVV